MPDTINTVVVLECSEELNIISNMPWQNVDGSVVIPGEMINIYNKGYDKHAYIEGKGKEAFVKDWIADRAFIAALFDLNSIGNFRLKAEISTNEDKGRLTIRRGDQSQELALPNTADRFQWVDLGIFTFQEKGINDFELHPVRGQWISTKVRTLKLEPVN